MDGQRKQNFLPMIMPGLKLKNLKITQDVHIEKRITISIKLSTTGNNQIKYFSILPLPHESEKKKKTEEEKELEDEGYKVVSISSKEYEQSKKIKFSISLYIEVESVEKITFQYETTFYETRVLNVFPNFLNMKLLKLSFSR